VNAEQLRNLIIVITLAIAALKVILNVLDVRSSRTALAGSPSAEVKKAVEYTATKRRFESTTTVISAVVVLTLLVLGLYGQIQQSVASAIEGQIWQDLVFLLVMALGLFVLGIPGSIYKTFVIEAKFGFNRTTVKTFVIDRIRGIILGVLILGPILLGLLWVYQQLPNQIWWIAFLAINLISFITAAIGTSVILPLFNKLKELPEGELRDKILALCEKQDYKLKRIYVMDGSKRSSKTNAFFSGIGKTKTIVLFDSLIENASKKSPLINPPSTHQIVKPKPLYNPDPRVDIREIVAESMYGSYQNKTPNIPSNYAQYNKPIPEQIPINNHSNHSNHSNHIVNLETPKSIKIIQLDGGSASNILAKSKPKTKDDIYQEKLQTQFINYNQL
jgi:Zn-dependent protease with chaperone function